MSALRGKAVVITGAGAGMGEAYAKSAAKLGAAIVVNDVDRAAAQALAEHIQKKGGRAIAHGGDVSVWSDAAALIARCVEAFGTIDGLVNNAGVMAVARLDELQEHGWRKVLDVNVAGTVNCAAHAVKHMIRQGRGTIVNVTSGAHMGFPAMGVYAASKGAIASLTYTWALELKSAGVRVNATSPRAATAMADQAIAYFQAKGQAASTTNHPGVEDNTAVIDFLLSDASAGVTGQIVAIDGAHLALGVHPGFLHPMHKRDRWTYEAVCDAFAADLSARQQPLGLAGLYVEPAPAPFA